MTTQKRRHVGRWLALGTTVGAVATWGGFGLVGAAPSTITTCTKVSNGKTAVIASTAVAQCTKKGKGTATTWDNHATVVAQRNAQNAALAQANQVKAILRYETNFQGSFTFHGVDLSHMYFGGGRLDALDLTGANLSGVNLVNAEIGFTNLTNANLTGASFIGATIAVTFGNTTCPDGSNSDANGGTCIGFGM